MITISQEDKTVKLLFELSIGFTIQFEYLRHGSMDATLLRMKMQENLNSRIEAIRREAYNEGWKDKTSHNTKKKEYFSGSIKL